MTDEVESAHEDDFWIDRRVQHHLVAIETSPRMIHGNIRRVSELIDLISVNHAPDNLIRVVGKPDKPIIFLILSAGTGNRE